MRIAMFSSKAYDRESFDLANRKFSHEIKYLEARLIPQNASLAEGSPAVCAFVNDRLDRKTLELLAAGKIPTGALLAVGALPPASVESLVAQAVATLPDKQRAVFVMRYYDEMSYEEISYVLKTSVGGLKANYFHALRKVQEFLKNATAS